MTVAIILSVYKKDKALPLYWAVQSLLHQTYKNILIFVRLDGEISRETERLVSLLEMKHDNLIISKNDRNRGLSYSLNQLIDIIIAKYSDVNYIARMDADDVSYLDRIKRQVQFLDYNENIDVLGTGCKEFGIYNKVIFKDEEDSNIKNNILKMTPFIHPSVMFRINVFDDGNRYPLNTVLSEDLAFWLDLSRKKYKFHNLKEVLLFYRINETTLIRRTGLKKALSEFNIRFKYLCDIRNDFLKNLFYIIGHFGIRVMPIFIVRTIYRLLR